MANLKKAAKGSKIKEVMIEQEVTKKSEYKGVFYDNASNSWGFRLSVKDGTGKKVDTDRKGFKTAYQAKTAREECRVELKKRVVIPEVPVVEVKKYDMTFTQVFDHYLEFRAPEKQPATIRRQKSLWEHHVKPVFGDKTLAEVTKGDLYDYLLKLYMHGDDFSRYKEHEDSGYSYAYVEGFLKFFWLIYGYAYDHGWVESERYTKDFLNKSTKLRMPEEIEEEEDEINDIRVLTQGEINQIKEVMKDSHLYLAFLICYHCGLRISECMGLMWKDFDIENHEFKVRRQLLYNYEEQLFYLAAPKTKKGKRNVYIPKALYDYLIEYKAQQDEAKQRKGYRATEIVYDRNGKDKDEGIQGGDFIQRKGNGELITTNSVKYWVDKVKRETGIDFHFHLLRHTNASQLAARNIPLNTLVKHLGHANANIAQKYYIASTETAEERLHHALDEIQ